MEDSPRKMALLFQLFGRGAEGVLQAFPEQCDRAAEFMAKRSVMDNQQHVAQLMALMTKVHVYGSMLGTSQEGLEMLNQLALDFYMAGAQAGPDMLDVMTKVRATA